MFAGGAITQANGNWVFIMDAIRWLMGETAPSVITAVVEIRDDDDRSIPDTMQVTFELHQVHSFVQHL